jgi:hypothetical protein
VTMMMDTGGAGMREPACGRTAWGRERTLRPGKHNS